MASRILLEIWNLRKTMNKSGILLSRRLAGGRADVRNRAGN